MKNSLLLIYLVSIAFFACQSGSGHQKESSNTQNGETDQISNVPVKENDETKNPADADANTVRLVTLTLQDLFKDDISKGLLNDSLSRQFKFSQYDLNGDGKMEILVGLTGPFFCGTGGCTQYLLTHQGDVITRFTVVRYPVFVANESTKGWRNLIMYSGRANRIVAFDGKTYPSNPSTLPELKGEPGADLPKLVDWENATSYKF